MPRGLYRQNAFPRSLFTKFLPSLNVGIHPALKFNKAAEPRGKATLTFESDASQSTMLSFVPYSCLLNTNTARNFDTFSLLPTEDECSQAASSTKHLWETEMVYQNSKFDIEFFKSNSILLILVAEEICRRSPFGQWVRMLYTPKEFTAHPFLDEVLETMRNSLLEQSTNRPILFPPTPILNVAYHYVSTSLVALSQRDDPSGTLPSLCPILDVLLQDESKSPNVCMELCSAHTLRRILVKRRGKQCIGGDGGIIQLLESILDDDERQRAAPGAHKMTNNGAKTIRVRQPVATLRPKKSSKKSEFSEVLFPIVGGRQKLRHSIPTDTYLVFFTNRAICSGELLTL